MIIILLVLCTIVVVVFGFVYAQAESNKQKIINLGLDEIDVMEGHQFEHYTAAMLQFDGFEQVQVTQASGDYGVDVIAYKDGHKWAFQCKRYSKNLGLKPIQEVYAGAKRYGADKAVVFTNVYFTPNAQSLANTLHVELWSRDKLSDMIWRRKQEEEAKKAFKESAKHGNCKKEKSKEQPETVEHVPKESTSIEEPLNVAEQSVEQIKPKEAVVSRQESMASAAKQEPKLEKEFMKKRFNLVDTCNEIKEKRLEEMATILSAGIYTAGVNIPVGTYDVKAVSGDASITIQRTEKRKDGSFEKTHVWLSSKKDERREYKGINLPDGWCFEITGDLNLEITKAKMVEIE